MARKNDDMPAKRADLLAMKGDVSTLKGDVSVLKDDVSVLKGDVSVLKGDVSGLRGEVQGLRSEFKSEIRRLDTKYDKLAAEMIWRFDQTASKQDVKDLRGDIGRIFLLLDKMNGALQDNQRSITLHAEMWGLLRQTTLSHEARLGAVEARLPPS